MKRPLVLGAACYTLGLLLGDQCYLPLRWLFTASFLTLIAALCFARTRGLLIWVLMVLTGWTNLAVRTAIVSPFDLRLLQGDIAELVTIRGTLSATPEERVFMRDDRLRSRTFAEVEVTEIQKKNRDWQPASGNILVLLPAKLPRAVYSSQIIEADGVLERPASAAAPGLFDYRNYLRRQNIHYLLKPENSDEWRVVKPVVAAAFSDRFIAWARKTLALGLPEEDQALHLLWAMTLGWRTALAGEVYRPFMWSGTMHVFAISGLHIALITGSLARLLLFARLPRSWCGGIILPFIWFYTGATGWQPSAIRSTIMMSIIVAGWALKRPSNLPNSLAAAALIILVWDPQQLFGASFQLSFFVVLSLALLMPPLDQLRDRLLSTDPMLPQQLVPIWRQKLTKLLRPIVTLAATSVAAWAGSIPLTALYFNLISPVTLIANMVVVPMSGLALAANMGSLLTAFWAPWCTILLNHAAWFLMRIMDVFSTWCACIPGAFWYIPAPSLTDVLFYYAGLIVVIIGWPVLLRRRWRITVLAVALGLYGSYRGFQPYTTTELVVLPLSGGTALYYNSPQHGHVLIDTGNARSTEFVTEPFLRSRGVNQLDLLLLTHGDAQHVGGATNIFFNFHPKFTAASPCKARSAIYRDALESFRGQAEVFGHISRGDRIAGWSVLHPDREGTFSRADDAALVLQQNLHGTSVLLLSDLGRDGQEALIDTTPHLHADIIVTGLAGDGQTLRDDLIEAARPELIIVCDAEWPASARANAALQQRLATWRIPVIYTRRDGPVTLRFRQTGWEARTMAQAAPGRRSFLLKKNKGEAIVVSDNHLTRKRT